MLPAATWYEKHDLNTTDMHPFVHSFNPAIAPPWQTRTDFDAFTTIAQAFSRARRHPPRAPARTWWPCRCCTTPPTSWPTRTGGSGTGRPASASRCRGVTMPSSSSVERDYGAVAAKMAALGPLLDTLGATTKGVTFEVGRELDYLRHENGVVRGGVADGRPSIARDVQACEAILALSGTTNGRLATQGFHTLERAPAAAGRPGRRARGQADHLRRHPGPAGRR